MPPAAATWLAGDALNNGTIKEYLKRYSPQEWPEVTKLTLIYGIVALQHSCEGRLLSLRELRQAVETSNTTLVVQRNVPQLQRQILQLQSQLDSVFDKLTPEGRVRQPAVAHPKPSDAWRQGEPSGYTSPPRSKAHPLCRSTDNQGATNPIYPDWWLAEPDAQQAADQQQQQSPRLVHPLQEQQQQLAISTFGMPGAQQQQQEQLLKGGLEFEPTLLLRPADAAASQGQQQQAELPWGWQGLAGASTADAGPSRAPAAAARARRPAAAVLGRGLPSLRHVESKIKQSVAAAAKVFAGDSSTEKEGRGAGGQGVEAASYAAMAAAEAEAADVEGELAAASDPGPSFGAEALRLHGELRATSSPTKRAAAAAATEFEGGFALESVAAGSAAEEQLGASDAGAAGGPEEADLAGSLLEGLGDTSAALRAALAQHGSVMALVGLLDSLGGQPGQAAAVHEDAGQQEAGGQWGGAAAQTAAWVAATAGGADSGASGAAAGGV
ncbi:hypothetical protein OEZ86_011296 [Tetradesmus obliquus]|nr:hypothetical protein OEZ86_011296 [Tetradesmus obliquus]